jgi:outer membrane immunogenic protein
MEMRKLLLSAVATLILAPAAANAADLRMPVKAPPAPMPPPFSWTGFYIGGNLGGAWAHHNFNDNLFPNLNFDNGTSNGVFIGGGQLGVNWQINQFVLGVEGTFDWASTNNNNNGVGVIIPGTGNVVRITSNDTWISSLAARLGWAVDRALFYFKGGGGWIGNNGFTITDVNTGASFSTSGNNNVSGWLFGGGLEWAFTDNWSLKVEYDYLGLGNRSFTVVSPVFPNLVNHTFTTSGSNNVQMVTVGLNYRFNWGGYPGRY